MFCIFFELVSMVLCSLFPSLFFFRYPQPLFPTCIQFDSATSSIVLTQHHASSDRAVNLYFLDSCHCSFFVVLFIACSLCVAANAETFLVFVFAFFSVIFYAIHLNRSPLSHVCFLNGSFNSPLILNYVSLVSGQLVSIHNSSTFFHVFFLFHLFMCGLFVFFAYLQKLSSYHLSSFVPILHLFSKLNFVHLFLLVLIMLMSFFFFLMFPQFLRLIQVRVVPLLSFAASFLFQHTCLYPTFFPLSQSVPLLVISGIIELLREVIDHGSLASSILVDDITTPSLLILRSDSILPLLTVLRLLFFIVSLFLGLSLRLLFFPHASVFCHFLLFNLALAFHQWPFCENSFQATLLAAVLFLYVFFVRFHCILTYVFSPYLPLPSSVAFSNCLACVPFSCSVSFYATVIVLRCSFLLRGFRALRLASLPNCLLWCCCPPSILGVSLRPPSHFAFPPPPLSVLVFLCVVQWAAKGVVDVQCREGRTKVV